MAEPRPHTGEWREPFLAALRNSGNVRASCLAAGVSRPVAYDHRKRSAKFRAAWDDAMEDAIDVLEAEARKRARASSDTLLIFLLKAHRPQLYRERYELTVVQKEAERIAAERGVEAAKVVDLAKRLAERTG